jgi:hypothetical protein
MPKLHLQPPDQLLQNPLVDSAKNLMHSFDILFHYELDHFKAYAAKLPSFVVKLLSVIKLFDWILYWVALILGAYQIMASQRHPIDLFSEETHSVGK